MTRDTGNIKNRYAVGQELITFTLPLCIEEIGISIHEIRHGSDETLTNIDSASFREIKLDKARLPLGQILK
jgi:hypothetical protein